MRLSAKPVINVSGVNGFDFATEWTIRAGEPNTLYFQLVDLDRNGLRYLAGIGGSNQPYSVSVKFPSIDSSAVITVSASQVDAADNSLWKVDLTALQVPASGNVVISVTEGSATRQFSLLNALRVEYPGNDGSC